MGILRITIGKKIALLLLIPLMGSFAAVGFFASYLRATRGDARFVNVAGRQRMLSAELHSWTHMVAIGQEEDRQGLRLRTAEFDASLIALRQGGRILDFVLEPAPAEVRPALDEVADFWRGLKPDLDLVADAPRASPPFRKAYGSIESRLQELRDRSNRVVTVFEARTERLKRRMRNILAAITSFMVLIFIAGLALSRRYIVRPLLRLDEAARRIGGGDFSLKLDAAGQDELSALAKTFNAMASRIGQLLDALNLRRKHAETIIASMPAGLVVLRGDLTVLRTNRGFRETFGIDESAAAGRPLEDVLPAAGLREAAREVLATGSTKHALRVEAQGNDGTLRSLRVTIAGTRLAEEEEEEEEEEELLVVVEDVSKEERLAQCATAMERRYHDVVENASDGIVVMGHDGTISYFNPAAEKMFGYERGRMIGRPVTLLMPEKYRERHQRGLARYLETGQTRMMGATVVSIEGLRADASVFPMEGSFSAYRVVGAEVFFTGILRDISERRRAEAEIKRNQADLRRANRNLKTLSEFNQRLIHNPDETTLMQDLCRILIEHGKYHCAQVVLADPDEKTGPRVMARAGCWKAFPEQGSNPWKGGETGGRLEACARTGRDEIANHILTDPERVSWRAEALRCGYASSIVLPLTDAKGRTYGTLMVSADEPDAFDEDTVKLLTELAGDLDHGIMAFRARVEHERTQEALLQNQAQLRQAQKMEAVGRLAGGIAHDFNNLLTAILGGSTFLLENLKPDDFNRADVLEIETAGKRAAALTKQLLAFSRKQMLNPRRMDINIVVKEMQSMLRRLIGEDIELAVLPHEKPLVVKVDRGQTEQVVMNLALNARDAMPNVGKIIIETAPVEFEEESIHRHGNIPPGSYVMLAVSDSGCGMSDAVQSHLFEPFFTTKEQGKGTGLGLSTVYGIVSQSGGHVTAYSEVGRGTTFKIYMPRHLGQAENCESAAARTELPTGSGMIILVEDETSVRELARRVLTLNGFTVIATGDPLEALTLCERHKEPIRLLVTDMVMPKLNGLELARKVRAARPGTPVLYMSGYTEHAILQQGLEELKGTFLQKPFLPRGLLEKVHEILGTRT